MSLGSTLKEVDFSGIHAARTDSKKKKKEKRRTETFRRQDQCISVIAQLRKLTGNSLPENNISLIIRVVIIIILLKLRMRMDADV